MLDGRDRRTASAIRVLAASVLAVVALASCIDDGQPGDQPTDAREDREGRTGQATADAASGTASPPEPVLAMTRFETPSGNIHCESFATSLICVIDSGLVPEPSHDFCPVDWIGVFIEVGEFAGPSCSGDPGIDRSPARVVPYERTWSRAGVTCHSENTGLTCEDAEGNGFTLARAGWELLGKESAATAAFGRLRALVRREARKEFGSDLETVSAPTLREGDECGPLQQAFVDLMVSDPDRPVIYEACFVSGTWFITDGPLFPD